jgi:beta-ureidopropionase / N-carbamoyl-L-amino-acid hydrolase
VCEFRADSQEQLTAIWMEIAALVEETARNHAVSWQLTRTSEQAPVAMDQTLQGIIAAAAESLGFSWATLPSGAGHDAQVMAGLTPTAMLFVPSTLGKSHCPDEHSEPEKLVAGARVLLAAVSRLAEEKNTLPNNCQPPHRP